MNVPSMTNALDASKACSSLPMKTTLNPCIRSQLEMCEEELLNSVEALGADHIDLVSCLTTLGLLYQHMVRDYAKALYYHQEALRILVKCRDEEKSDRKKLCEDIAVTLTDLAFIYESHSEFPCALANFTEAKRLLQSINAKETDHKLLSCICGCDRLVRFPESSNENKLRDENSTAVSNKHDEFVSSKPSTSWRRHNKLKMNSDLDLMPANYKLGM
jgi:hypothetical protein